MFTSSESLDLNTIFAEQDEKTKTQHTKALSQTKPKK